MLREWKEPVRPGEEELKMRLVAAREKLAAQQLLIKEQKVPVLVLLEGWGTAVSYTHLTLLTTVLV